MKKLLIPALTLVLALILLIACGEANVEEESRIDQLRDQYSSVGIEHNEGMDYVYNKLISVPNISDMNYEEGLLLVENANKEFASVKYGINSSKTQFNQISNYFSSYKNKELYFAKSSINESLFDNQAIIDSLSENQKVFLDRLDQILYNEIEIDSKIKEINKLEEDAILIFNECEIPLFFCVTSVAKYSLIYWTDNIDSWVSLISGDNSTFAKTSGFWRDLGNIAGWDVVGAGVGALTGLATAGTTSLPLAAVGALAASTFAIYDMATSQ